MKRYFGMMVAVSLATAALAMAAEKEGGTPMMVSFTEMKWTALPERKGMQFAVLSGDHRVRLRIGQGLRPRISHRHARQLGARQRLPRRKRLRVLSGGQGKVRLPPRCGGETMKPALVYELTRKQGEAA